MDETFLIPTGASASLPIFPGGTDLCQVQEEMEDVAGYSVWREDLSPVNSPQKNLIDPLLWHLNSDGICCGSLSSLPLTRQVG
jgi:hypothetical protein